jgi:putative FmdB family regulatory protein
MPIYQYNCEDCLIIWEKECPIGKAPKKVKCKSCSSRCERFFDEINFSFGDDGCGGASNKGAMDFYSVKQRYRKFAVKGFDKDSANKFLKRSIAESGERLAERSGRYKKVDFNWDNMARDGIVKRLSDKETTEKIERSKKITQDISNKHTAITGKKK